MATGKSRTRGSVTRREFTAGVVLAIAASSRKGVFAAEPPAFQLRYIVASCMYGKLPLAEILPEVKKTGAGGIDIWGLHHGNQWEQVVEMGAGRFNEMLREHDVRLDMATRWGGPAKIVDDLRFAGQLGAELFVTGFVPHKDALPAFLEQAKPAVEMAEELGVTLAIENHGSSPDEIKAFADAAPSDRIGVALAPYHLPQDGRTLANLIEALGPKLKFFYAWQHGRGCMTKLPKQQELEQMPGRGKLDFTPLLTALQTIDYRGWTEIFMHPVPRGIPILPTAAEVTAEINRARRYLEACLAGVGS
jgi:sugar phosphate isomerase/epimerase